MPDLPELKGPSFGAVAISAVAGLASFFAVNQFLQKPLEDRIDAARIRFEDHLENVQSIRNDFYKRLDELEAQIEMQNRNGTEVSRDASNRIDELRQVLIQVATRLERLESGRYYRYQLDEKTGRVYRYQFDEDGGPGMR